MQHDSCSCGEIQRFMRDPAHTVPDQSPWLERGHTLPISEQSHSRSNSFGAVEPSEPVSDITMEEREVANNESALEALLTSSINHDTSEEGIAKQVAR